MHCAVKRMAWSIAPEATSLKLTRPGRMGSPAASAEVNPAGRKAFEFRCQMAPDPAVDFALAWYFVSYVSICKGRPSGRGDRIQLQSEWRR